MSGIIRSSLIILLIASVSWSKEKNDACVSSNSHRICHSEGVLVEVTEQSSDDMLLIVDKDLLEIKEGAFKNLSIAALFIAKTNISVLTRGSFEGLENLKRLYLSETAVRLSPNLFSELKQLELLWLKTYERIS
ncbi:uncharacterized protein LOC143353764 [Halictus rubicundus]|uniref:uncharacterized protein LOC143353764 n=1 Tax=Halictus rubicundus TaxID=77578 RepID=UPI0040355BD0